MPPSIRTSFSGRFPAFEVCHLNIILEHYQTLLVLKIRLFLEDSECLDEFSMFIIGHIRGMIKALAFDLRTASCRRVHQFYPPFPPGVGSSCPAVHQLVAILFPLVAI